MYLKELEILKQKNRYRERKLFHEDHFDLASNDYLKLSENRDLYDQTIGELSSYKRYASTASQLVNGYHQVHKDLEETLIRLNDFEDCVILGSGFLANIALFEALPRSGDILFVDEDYHASGIFATANTKTEIIFFKHNNLDDLISKFDKKAKRKFVAVEGIYSMGGDLVDEKLLRFAQENATVILDEAHSSGTIGDNLLGILDHYQMTTKNIIKMGTLGKAYGSYGAYILACQSVIDFLVNRAKPIIYSTALSLFDTIYAKNSINFINNHSKSLSKKINKKIELTNNFGYKTDSLILNIPINSNSRVLEIQQELLNSNFLVGAIRNPTVKIPQLRVILREEIEILEQFFETYKAKYE